MENGEFLAVQGQAHTRNVAKSVPVTFAERVKTLRRKLRQVRQALDYIRAHNTVIVLQGGHTTLEDANTSPVRLSNTNNRSPVYVNFSFVS